GRFVVFESAATNLLEPAETTFGGRQVFRYDRDADGDGVFDETAPGATKLELAGRKTDGTQINSTLEQSISATGRYVVFYTSDPTVTGLSPPCVNSPFLGGAPCGEIMLRDMDTGTTEIVSIGPGNV